MARMTLIDINANDELPSVIRKCNDNFRRMSSQQSRDTDLSVRLEGERSDAALAEAMAGVAAALAEMRTWVEQAVEGLRTWVAAEIAKVTQPRLFAPPVGTYLYCEQDPSSTWSGTVWERQQEGLYMIASGDTVSVGSTVGANSLTLTTAQMPQHSHSGPSHTHTMAHTHAHNGSGAAASSNGGHAHNMRWGSYYARYFKTDAGSGSKWELVSYATSDNGGAGDLTAEWAGAHTHSLTGSTGASSAGSTGSSGTGSTGTAGGSSAFDNRPLSLAAPLWKRTA